MSLHYQQHGAGTTLALLHGWGLNHHVWSGVLPSLSASHRVLAIDLPGHGNSDMPNDGAYELSGLAAAVTATLATGDTGTSTRAAIVLGWSLGGLVALQMALQLPSQVRALILVASSPRFARADDWPQGMEPNTLADFAEQLTQDYHATVQRFLALQAMGSANAREEIRFLRESLLKEHEPNPAALRGGLQLLQHSDLRAQLGQIHCPVLIINGERDRLVSPLTGKAMAQAIPQATHVVIKGAGHAPFLSHTDVFLELVERFIHDK